MTHVRLAICTTHPVQYYAPLFREIAKRLDLEVLYAHRATPEDQAGAGFGTAFDWDVDLTGGYAHSVLANVAARPGLDRFGGCDTPGIGARLKEGRFDAVLIFGWGFKSSLQALFAAKRLGLPVLVRGDSQLAATRGPAVRLAKAIAYPPFLRLYDAACYVGERSRDYFRRYEVPESRLFRSPHCVDTGFFAERATKAARDRLRTRLGVAADESLVLFAGKLVPFKRPLDVVSATAHARAQGLNVGVLVAGAGELDQALKRHAAQLGVALYSLGFQNQSQMPAAYAAADVLMLPSDGRETWGMVCNEALASGKPILVSSAVGCSDDLVTRETGGVHALGNSVQAGRRLAALLSTPPKQADIRAMSERYNLAAAADGVLAAVSAAMVRGGSADRNLKP